MEHLQPRTSFSSGPRPLRNRALALAALLLVSLATANCAGNNGDADNSIQMDEPKVQTVQKDDGSIIERYDLDGNGNADIVKHIQTYEDPDDPDVIKRRMVKKEIDVNSDGQIDIVTEYDEDGKRKKETVDANFDGARDFVNYFDNDALARKEIYGPNGENVATTRFYSGGKLSRVERDRNSDGKVDYWEYYDNETLERIGKDRNGDEKIDSWTYRAKKEETPTATATEDVEGPDLSGASEEGGTSDDGEESGSSDAVGDNSEDE